jgi:hypothetical protein
MADVIYNTIEECEKAIATLKVIGMPIPEWITTQHRKLKESQNTGATTKNRKTPIYDTLVANYPYVKMP